MDQNLDEFQEGSILIYIISFFDLYLQGLLRCWYQTILMMNCFCPGILFASNYYFCFHLEMANSNKWFHQDRLDEPIRKLYQLLNVHQLRDVFYSNPKHVESEFYQNLLLRILFWYLFSPHLDSSMIFS